MSTIAEVFAPHSIASEPNEVDDGCVLVLVQGNQVISTFPAHQVDAAIDLARVLCRALAQVVDIFRISRCGADRVWAGGNADTGAPEWTHLAHVSLKFLLGVDIDVRDPETRENLTKQLSTP